MPQYGYKLMTEEHGPKALVENAARAEAAGFDFCSISDHFHPWHKKQGHAPFAWGVLGSIAQATHKIGLATGLTCPIIRYHPAIIAQAAATIALLSDNRFTLAVGAGERLNEHIVGERWPSIPERHAMVAEAIDIMRELWTGELVNHRGEHYRVVHARLYDCPEEAIPVVVGVSGEHSVNLAAQKADGIMATAPDGDLVRMFAEKKGAEGPSYGEAALCHAASENEGLAIAHEKFRFSAFDWSVNSEIPDVEGFDAASKFVRKEDLADAIPTGPDPEKHLAAIRKYVDAGFSHIVLVGIGPDQAGFIDFFEKELRPHLP